MVHYTRPKKEKIIVLTHVFDLSQKSREIFKQKEVTIQLMFSFHGRLKFTFCAGKIKNAHSNYKLPNSYISHPDGEIF